MTETAFALDINGAERATRHARPRARASTPSPTCTAAGLAGTAVAGEPVPGGTLSRHGEQSAAHLRRRLRPVAQQCRARQFPHRPGRRAGVVAASQSHRRIAGRHRRCRRPPPAAGGESGRYGRRSRRAQRPAGGEFHAAPAWMPPASRASPPKSSTPASSASSRPVRRASFSCSSGRPT